MEHSIPALVIAAILVLGSVILAGVTHSSLDQIGQSWRELESLSEERLGTELTVVSTQVSNGGADVTVVMRNEGRTPIQEPAHMDIIVNYQGTDSQRYTAWIPYTNGALSDNTWTLTGISGDYRNPGIVDAGEEMTIQIRLNPATAAGPDRWIVIATETGVSYSIYF